MAMSIFGQHKDELETVTNDVFARVSKGYWQSIIQNAVTNGVGYRPQTFDDGAFLYKELSQEAFDLYMKIQEQRVTFMYDAVSNWTELYRKTKFHHQGAKKVLKEAEYIDKNYLQQFAN